jgi:predicted lipoprotein with Yx(FWY)xxD motif
MQSKLLVTAATVAAALLAAGCGSTTPSSAAASPASSPAAAAATIAVATNAKLGKILVDRSGMTVYLFVNDTGTSSTCYGSCASFWPPVLTGGAPLAGAGAQASLIGTTMRTDGTIQVTYAGHPLYLFVHDKQAGDTTGQGLNTSGGLWWVLTPTGAAMH